ncbi:MAG: MMPL family transporter, partial [Aeromicrobium sp.]
ALLLAGTALLSEGTDNTYTIPGTESQEALDALARTFPQVSGTSAQLVAVAPDGATVTDPGFQQAVEASATAIAKIPQVSSASSPYGSSSGAGISQDSSAVLVPVQLTVGTTAVEPSTSDALQAAGRDLERSLPDGSQVAVGGQLFSQDPAGISITELLGIALAYVVLLVTFGALVAAGLPLVTALLGVGVSLAVVLIATRFWTITSTTPLLALMLGLAVGIDYSLFIISRHQEQLKRGIDPQESAGRAVATSGSAVVFAATTVIIALLGLSVAGIPFLTTMGIAAALAVAVAVAVAVTLTPALLGFAGWRVVPRRFRPGSADPPHKHDEHHPRRGLFPVWVRVVTRWPVVTVLVVVGVLGLATTPASTLRLALPDAGSLEDDAPARIAYDLIADHFGPGYNGPLLVTGSVIQSTDPTGLMNDLATDIAAVDGVVSVPLSTPNETGDTGIVQVVPDGSPDSEATKDLVTTLRSMHDAWQKKYSVDLSVTGYTAAGIDISDQLAGALVPFGVLVVGLSLILLAMVFRSIVVPLTAALGYVLSLGAALGLTSLVFIDGTWSDALNVADVGVVISFMPIILMGVLFGLAMDYEVFLVSRMREDYVHGGDPVRAVHAGFVGSARVVTAAATIMFAVFAAFVPEGDASIQPIAFGLAVGVAIDAFVVRMSLIPAVLVLFGRAAWWMPRWLDRRLPRFDVEGEGLTEELALADWPAPGSAIAIAADDVRVAGGPDEASGLTVMVPRGETLILLGGTAARRSALLLALGGRRPIESGRLKVVGHAVPPRGAAVRARSAHVPVDGPAGVVTALDDALASRPALLLVDVLVDPTDPAVRRAVRRALTGAARDTDSGHGPTVVMSCHGLLTASELLPLDAAVHVVRLTGADDDDLVLSGSS